jgi:hypothetical protein
VLAETVAAAPGLCEDARMSTFPPVVPTTVEMQEALRRDGDDAKGPLRRFYRGDTLLFPFVVVDRASGAVVDVTGWTFRLTAKFALANPDRQAAFEADNAAGGSGGLTLPDSTKGQVLATIAPAVTQCWADGPERVIYDLQATDGAGVITTVEMGEAVVLADVTRTIGG